MNSLLPYSESGQLRNQLALPTQGLVESPSCPDPGLAHRLNLVEDRQRRWRNLDWWKTYLHPLTGGCPMYEISSNAFAQLFENWVPGEDSHTKATCLNVLYLPSAARNAVDILQVPHTSLGPGEVLELAMDSDQDLLLLVNIVEIERIRSSPM